MVLESRVYPGVTKEIVMLLLEKNSGMNCGVDFKETFYNLLGLFKKPPIKEGAVTRSSSS